MNKTKTILLATGCAAALAVLALAVLTWFAFAERTAAFEGDDESAGLEGVVSSVSRLVAKKPYPNAANQKRLEANARVVEDWCGAARTAAAVGDWKPEAGCTPAQFKEQIANDVKGILRKTALPEPTGDSAVVLPEPLVKPDFAFGPFKDYLADKMPTAAQLPRLQRQWYDLTSLIDVLATTGVVQLVDLQVIDRAAEAAKAAAQADKAKGKKKAKKKAAETDVRRPSVETYRVAFMATPKGLARVLQTLSFQERFTVVEDFTYARERDTIAERLGGVVKKEEASAPSGGRRARQRGAARDNGQKDEKEDGKKQDSVIFDPQKDGVVKAELTVSVYDFRSLEDEEEGASK